MNTNEEKLSSSLDRIDTDFDTVLSSCFVKVFIRLFIGLIITTLAAFLVANSYDLQMIIFDSPIMFFGLIIFEFFLVITISSGLNKISAATANVLYFIFSIVNGLTLASIFWIYADSDIYLAFGIAAMMFGVMALYGATTKKNLTSIGNLCLMGLLGIIIAGVSNLFFKSGSMDIIISFLGVIIFVGLTAYDTQRIKHMLFDSYEQEESEEVVRYISVFGALMLYLDFINLFLKLLRLLSKKK
jgi:Integral membrane protein, interacts with FtsH